MISLILLINFREAQNFDLTEVENSTESRISKNSSMAYSPLRNYNFVRSNPLYGKKENCMECF